MKYPLYCAPCWKNETSWETEVHHCCPTDLTCLPRWIKGRNITSLHTTLASLCCQEPWTSQLCWHQMYGNRQTPTTSQRVPRRLIKSRGKSQHPQYFLLRSSSCFDPPHKCSMLLTPSLKYLVYKNPLLYGLEFELEELAWKSLLHSSFEDSRHPTIGKNSPKYLRGAIDPLHFMQSNDRRPSWGWGCKRRGENYFSKWDSHWWNPSSNI